MFRYPAARLSQLASPLLKRGLLLRTQTSVAEQTIRPRNGQETFWSSGRVLLFGALTGTSAYLYAVNGEVDRRQLPWLNSSRPRYASKSVMEKVRCKACNLFRTTDGLTRRFTSCKMRLEKMPSAPTTKTSICTDTRSGRQSTLNNSQLPWHIPNLPKRSLESPKYATSTRCL